MQSKAATPAEYLASLDPERKVPVTKLHHTIKENLPKGFVDTMTYELIGELATKMTPTEWIAHYEKNVKR